MPPAENRRYAADDVCRKDELRFCFSFLNTGYLCDSVLGSTQGLVLFCMKKSAAWLPASAVSHIC